MKTDSASLNRSGTLMILALLASPLVIVLGIKSIDCYVSAQIHDFYPRLFIVLAAISVIAWSFILARRRHKGLPSIVKKGMLPIAFPIFVAVSSVGLFLFSIFALNLAVLYSSGSHKNFIAQVVSKGHSRYCHVTYGFYESITQREIGICGEQSLRQAVKVGDEILVSELTGPLGVRVQWAENVP